MRLRTKLALALFLLAVVPLAAVTLVSYRSSCRTFREAVEREASGSTKEMGERMELLAGDLGRRVRRLGSVPFGRLMEGEPGAVAGLQEAGAFWSRLRGELGDAAPYLESLEYTPQVSRPTPDTPHGRLGAAPPPGAETVTIHLEGMTFESGDAQQPAHVLRAGREVLLIPGRMVRVGRPASGPEGDLAALVTRLQEVASSEEFAATARRLAEMARVKAEIWVEVEEARSESARIHGQVADRIAAVEHDVELIRGELPEDLRGVVARRIDELEQRPPGAGLPAAPAALLPRLRIEQELACALEEGGEPAGQIRAKLNTRELLHAVMERGPTAPDDIAFVVGEDGTVYTPDPEHAEQLAGLDLAGLAGSEELGIERVGENWVVATRNLPELGVAFGIARPVGESLEEFRRTSVLNLLLGLGIVGVAILGIVPLTGRMTRNLSRLTEGAARLAGGDLGARVAVRSNDEIGELARVFNGMGESLQRNQRELVHQERLRKELEMCRQIQHELLPSGRWSCPFAELRAVSIPAREVGGDFFNYFTLPGGEVAVLVGDVSGKGVPAALLMANLQATLRARLPLERDLAELARRLDDELERSTPAETYVTLFMGVFDTDRAELRYVNAGHNTQYALHGSGEVVRLESGGRPLGLLAGGAYRERRVSLAPGDLLFLFTDGLVEVEDAAGEAFGEERVERLLSAGLRDDPDDVLAAVEQAARGHRGQAEPADDATMLLLRIEELQGTTAAASVAGADTTA